MGHLADLRGDRERSAARPSRTATSSRSTRTTRTPTATRSRSRRSAATRTRRCVVDPDTGTIYLTEDAGTPNGLLYRWTPPAQALPLGKGSLRRLADDAGTLEALKASTRRGAHVPDLSVATEPGTTYRVEWVAVPDRDAQTVSTRKQFTDGADHPQPQARGHVVGRRRRVLRVLVRALADGSAAQHDGQVWFLDPLADTIELKLHFAYTPRDQDTDPDGPDNITVSAYGGVIIAEDGDGKQHLVGATESGEAFFFARNEHPDDSEFAGPTFSHDKKILFANIQAPGLRVRDPGPVQEAALLRAPGTAPLAEIRGGAVRAPPGFSPARRPGR